MPDGTNINPGMFDDIQPAPDAGSDDLPGSFYAPPSAAPPAAASAVSPTMFDDIPTPDLPPPPDSGGEAPPIVSPLNEGYDVGSILPIARNKQTGDYALTAPFPSAFRGLAQGPYARTWQPGGYLGLSPEQQEAGTLLGARPLNVSPVPVPRAPPTGIPIPEGLFETPPAAPPAAPTAAPVAPAPGPSAPPPPSPSVINLGGMGNAIGANLRDMLWEKLQRGDTTELGRPSNILVAAKQAMDAGQIRTRADFDNFTNTWANRNAPAAGGGGGGGAAVEPPAPGPTLPEAGPVETVPVTQPDGSVVLEQILTQATEPSPSAAAAPAPAGEPPVPAAPAVSPEPTVPAAAGPVAPPPPPPLPRSATTIQAEEGIGGPQAIRKANAERAAYLAATGQEHPRDQRGELEAILADPRSNEEIQQEMDAPKLASLQQTTDDLPHGFSIQRQGDSWVLTDPAGVEQMRVDARLPSEEASAQMGQTAAGLAQTVDYSEHNRIGDGTAANPIVPHQPSDIAAAAQQVAEPTPAQAEAENYRMGHVDLGGMDVSIETAAGGIRSGDAPDGTHWEVQMPYDYGHINGTVGADGQQIDIALGPQAHQATTLPVYVVDQKDAHSWAFDEHKAFAGFPTQEAAQHAYQQAFSDGYGSQRMGAITPMTFEQFKKWAFAKGPRTEPVAYAPPPIIAPAKRKAIFNRPLSLLEFLAASGGVRDQGGELEAIGLTKKFIPKIGALVRKTGMNLDRAREAAQEAGYLPAESNNGPPQIGISDLLNLMAQEATGRKVFTPEDEAEMFAAEQARQEEGEKARFDEARKTVFDLAAFHELILTPAQIEEAAIAVMGGRDPKDAITDAVVHAGLEEDAKTAEAAKDGSGWDIPFDLETDPDVQAGEFPGVTTPKAGSEPAGAGSNAAGEPAAGGVQPASGDGDVSSAAGGGSEAVPGHGQQPIPAKEPEFGLTSSPTNLRTEAPGGRVVQGAPARPDHGLFAPATGNQTDLIDAVKAEQNFGSIAAPNIPELAQEFGRRFLAGEKFATIQHARKVASALLDGPVHGGTAAAKAVDEAVELGAVLAARTIVAQGAETGATYDRLVHLYEEQQPKLGTRTSDSIERQAYSTPLPLAYLASRLAGVAQAGSVFEPTAGNGALLIEASPATTSANEIDPERAASLAMQGFAPTQFNAAAIQSQARAFDTVIANPPFGAVRGEDGNTVRYPLDFIQPGYDTGEIDHAISLFSLETMKDDGTSVLILGGLNKLLRTPRARADGYNGKAKREFFYTLFNHYNVVDHFTVAGELYEKQGAGWPVDVLVIRGRGKSALPLPSIAAPRILGSWSALKEVLDVSINGPGPSLADQAPSPGVGNAGAHSGEQRPAPAAPTEEPATQPGNLSEHAGAQGGVDAGAGGGLGGGGEQPGGRAGAPGGVERPEPVPGPGDSGSAAGSGEPSVPGFVRGEAATEPVQGEPDAGGGARDQGEQPAGVDELRAPAGERQPGAVAADLATPPPDLEDQIPTKVMRNRRKPEVASKGQSAYEPASNAGAVGTLVPSNLRTAIAGSLTGLEERVGPVDKYVADKLDYSVPELRKYFSAEQIDALALGIENIDKGEGFIIGDQTGVGKGRFVAGMIRYADRKGLIPVFVTEKPNLYIDMVRDLTDIGMADYVDKILPTNSALRLPLSDDPKGPALRTPGAEEQRDTINEIANSGRLPEGKRALFTTYAQQQQISEADTPRMRALRSIASNAFLILDEAHNAGGAGAKRESSTDKVGAPVTRSQHFRELVNAAKSVAYSSATWAKRPDVLDLYGAKTEMRQAVENLSALADAVKHGGVPMQQIVTAQLASVGQYIRRERSFDGVTYDMVPVKVDEDAYDKTAGVLADIFKISDEFVKDAIKKIDKDLKGEAGAAGGSDSAVGSAGAHSTGFGSVMHNLINQMLLASKTPAVVERAIEKMKEGKKPVIALANTMGSFIADFADQTDAKPGDAVDLTFNSMLNRYLERTLRYTVRKPFMKKGEKAEVRYLKPEQLGASGLRLYRATEAAIKALDLKNLPVSPIDYMRAEMAKAGYKVAEITGRTEALDYRADGRSYYRNRSTAETSPKARLAAIRGFNQGTVDAMIINQSGAAGLSLHASEKNPPAGQAKRAMLIAQAEANIDTFMQILGRVHRTGQVKPPEYEQLVADVPAEKRPAAVLANKMASLSASTTSSRKGGISAENTPDFMNKYGGQVVKALLEERPELAGKLGLDPNAAEDAPDLEGLARKVTGRIPLLRLKEQAEIYDLIEERYRALIADLDAAGENGLEAKTLELDAKPLDSKTMVDGHGNSPFTSPAMLEHMDVKRTTKPPSPEQVQEWIAFAVRHGASTEDQIARVTDAEEAAKTSADDLFKDPEAAKRFNERNAANTQRLTALIRLAAPGSMVNISSGDLPARPALVLGMKAPAKGNPLAPSAWELTVLMDDGIRRAIPGSTLWTADTKPQSEPPEDMRIISAAPAGAMQPFIDEMKALGAQARENRYIITGNILAGFAKQRGQIINFTDANGDLRQGVMLSRDFDANKFLAKQSQPMRGDLATSFLTQRYADPPFLTSSDSSVRVAQDTSGRYLIAVPQSKRSGGAYFLDKGLLRALGADFISSGSEMRARFGGAQLPDVMEALEGVLKREGAHLVSDHPEAKAFAAAQKGDSRASVAGWNVVDTQPETIAPAAFKVLADSVAAMTGDRVHIRYVDGGIRLADPSSPGGYVPAYGANTGAVLITVALSTPVGTKWVLHHEAVHSLRGFGLIQPAEWNVLERAADQQGWAVRYGVAARYQGRPIDVQREEAIAEAFADFMSQRQPTPAGMIGRAVQRSSRFLERLRSGLTGEGFTRPQDVFERVATGKVGQREAKPMPNRVTDLPTALKSEILNGFSFHPKEMGQTLVGLAQTGEVDRDIAVEVAKSFAALAAPGNPQQAAATSPNAVPVAGGVANTIAAHLTNVDRIIEEMLGKKGSPIPMAGGTPLSRKMAKDAVSALRKIRWFGNRLLESATKQFTHEQLVKMWEAADTESVARQTGNSAAGVGLDTLTPAERSAVEGWQKMASTVFNQARAVGIHNSPELPSYVPRMVVGIGNYEAGEPTARVVRDIRTLILATIRLQEAIIGRRLINQIKEVGRRTGRPTVSEGEKPARNWDPLQGIHTTTPNVLHREHLTVEETEAAAQQYPAQDSEFGWFTIDESPAFHTRVWDGNNEDGTPRFKTVPIYIRSDFEGPLRAITRKQGNSVVNGLLNLKYRMMTAIMYGVAHSGVISTRVVSVRPAFWMAAKEGYQAKQDGQTMNRLLDGGLVPVGSRGAYQEAKGFEEEFSMKPGRSMTAHLMAFIPGLVHRPAGESVKKAIDRAGDFVHKTLVWDYISALQIGTALHLERKLIARGADPAAATKMAARLANNTVGAIPQEAMAQWARTTANMLLFSPSYRFSVAAVLKDAITGLPRDIQAQLGGEAAVKQGKSMARRLALMTVLLELSLFYVGGAIFQSALHVVLGGSTLSEELKKEGEIIRKDFAAVASGQRWNPVSILKDLMPMSDNEPGKESRVLVGFEKNGTGIYIRPPTGKIGQDIQDYLTDLRTTLFSIMNPLMRAAVGAVTNVVPGTTTYISDPYASTTSSELEAIEDYIKFAFESTGPSTAYSAAGRIIHGKGTAFDVAQIVGGGLGFSVSHGYPGGPVRGEIHALQQQHEFQVEKAIPRVMELAKQGDVKGASEIMTKLGMKPQQQRAIIFQAKQPHATVSQLKTIMRFATPEERGHLQERMQEDRGRRQQ